MAALPVLKRGPSLSSSKHMDHNCAGERLQALEPGLQLQHTACSWERPSRVFTQGRSAAGRSS